MVCCIPAGPFSAVMLGLVATQLLWLWSSHGASACFCYCIYDLSVKLLVSRETDPAHSVQEMLYKQALPSNAYKGIKQNN